MAKNNLPPFSLFHDYTIEWGKFRREHPNMYQFMLTDAERRVLAHLCMVGAMSRTQMYAIGWGGSQKRKQIRRMVGYRIIDEHTIIVNGVPTLFYTPCGINKKYTVDELLQKFVFTQLFIRLSGVTVFQVLPASLPFVGGLRTAKKSNMVAVVKNNIDVLKISLKSNKQPVIFVFENEQQVELLREYIRPDTTIFYEKELFERNDKKPFQTTEKVGIM